LCAQLTRDLFAIAKFLFSDDLFNQYTFYITFHYCRAMLCISAAKRGLCRYDPDFKVTILLNVK